VVKKFGEKATLQGLVKKTLVNVDLHCQSKINSKTKPNKAGYFLVHAGHYRL